MGFMRKGLKILLRGLTPAGESAGPWNPTSRNVHEAWVRTSGLESTVFLEGYAPAAIARAES